MPRASIKENRTTIFKVISKAFNTTKVSNMDKGIEIATNNELPTPKKNSRTITISMSPEMILFSKLLTISPT